jgi:hypothetical protein
VKQLLEEVSLMIWKNRNKPITIPAELHEKISRSCPLLNEVQSEIVKIRTASERVNNKRDVKEPEGPGKFRL